VPVRAGRLVQADALILRVREGGRTVLVHGLIATGVNGDGKREILGFGVTSAEDGGGLMCPAAAGSLPHRRWAFGTGWRAC
jgi:Transposase, Mutator family